MKQWLSALEAQFGPLTFANTQRVRLRTLNLWRWFGIVGQSLAITGVHYGMGFPMPVHWCFAIIAASAWLNVILSFLLQPATLLTERQATLLLAFDIAQLTLLLMLTGGIENPFIMLYIAPVVISATNLSLFATTLLGVFSFASILFITVFHWPLPWHPGQELVLPALYLGGIWTSLVLGIGFTAVYAWRTAHEGRTLSTALAATQAALAREQRLSDLGALAAATAHELGTPLGTITVVARELERELPHDSPYLDDVRLLRSQAERCREILGRLAQHDTGPESAAQRLPLPALLDEIAEPHRGFGIDIVIRPLSSLQPNVRRAPEVIHSLGNLIDNAVDYARTAVTVEAGFQGEDVLVRIQDDGPGFDPGVLDRLGEPYVTTRAAGQVERREQDIPNLHGDGHEGLGLGIFISKTLIERSGGRMEAENKVNGGAQVTVTWPKRQLDPGKAGVA